MKKLLFILGTVFLLSFSSDKSKSAYTIPMYVNSVIAIDYDLDGDQDLITGHKQSEITHWGGFSILENIENKNFNLIDSVFVEFGFPFLHSFDLNNNEYPDFFSSHVSLDPYTCYISIYRDYGLFQYDSVITIEIANDLVGYFDTGDLNNDGKMDIVFASNHGQFWGVIYNDGNGNFTNPEYFETPEAHPNSIDCGDINNDGRADIVLCRQKVEVFFSTEQGFENLTIEEGGGKVDAELIDFDLDGDLDIITYGVWHYTFISYHENIGDMQFKAPINAVLDINTAGFSVSDFDNNHYPDLVFELLNYNGYWIYYNSGNLNFTDSLFVNIPPTTPKESVRNFHCADMDNNGYQDIICVKSKDKVVTDNLEIKYNNGEGSFVDNPISAIHKQYISNNSISAYPNPFQTNTSIHFELKTPSLININITNINGQIVYQQQKYCQAGGNQILWDGKDININNCQSGVYIVSISTNNKITKHIKIIKR